MRFATITYAGRAGAAVLTDDGAHPLPDLSVEQLVAMGLEDALAVGEETLRQAPPVPPSEVRLQVPLRPSTIRDFVAFEEHVVGVRRSVDGQGGVPPEWYAAPTFYFTNPHRVLGDGDEVAVPGGSQALDLELEVAAVVGTRGRDLTPDEGEGVIFGYTIFADWSARDLQSREMKVGLGPCKGKDFASALGPWIVTADELAHRRDADGFLDLACTVAINGEVVGEDLLDHVGWTFGSLVAYASRDSVVVPGDVLGSGTVGNGGCLAELWGRRGRQEPRPLRPGDEVRLTVEGLGTLTSRIARGHETPAIPAARIVPQAERERRREQRFGRGSVL